MNTILALSGKKGAGKSEISKSLEGFIRFSFADELRNIISRLYDVPLEVLKDPIKKEEDLVTNLIWNEKACQKLSHIIEDEVKYDWLEPVSFSKLRGVLQFIGTDVLQKHDPNFHVSRTVSKLDPKFNYVNDDLRFPKERDALKGRSDFLYQEIYIIRPDNWNVSNHISETSLNWSMFDRYIINNGSKEKLLSDFYNEKHNTFSPNSAFLKEDEEAQKWSHFIFQNGEREKDKYIVFHKDFYQLYNLIIYLNKYRYKSDSVMFQICDKHKIIIDCPFVLENLKFWYANRK